MKKYLSLQIIVIVIGLISCSIQSEESIKTPVQTIEEDHDNETSFQTFNPTVSISPREDDTDDEVIVFNTHLDEQFLTSGHYGIFLETVNEKFGLRLTISDRQSTSISGTKGITPIYLSEITDTYLNRENLLVSLNDILERESLKNIIPNYLINDITDADGNIWGMPSQLTILKPIRVYNSNLLSEINMDVPTNTAELFSYLMAAKQSNLNIINVRSYQPATEFYDIFSSFGCLITNDMFSPFSKSINWNVNTESFEDVMLTEEMLMALKYIQLLRDEKLISLSEENSYTLFIEGNLATLSVSGYIRYSNTISYSLAPSNITEIVQYADCDYYVITKETKNAEEKFGKFLEVFIGNVEGNLLGHYGVNKVSVDYSNPEHVLVLKGNNVINGYPLISWPWMTLNPYTASFDTATTEEISQQMSSKKEYISWIEDGIQSSKLKTLPVWPAFRTSGLRDENIDAVFNKMFYEFLSSDIFAEELVNNYISKVRQLGGNEYLNKLNEAVESHTNYTY